MQYNIMATRKHSNAKEKIVEAASDLFFEQGYQATTIDHVIERSGVSRPTLYTHFKTKEELERHGIETITIPGSELVRGLGGPRCMSMPLNRSRTPLS